MTAKSEFTEDEWSRILRAPFVAGMAITLSDPGGAIEVTKETMATLKAASNPPGDEELLAEAARDVQAMTQRRESPLRGYRPTAEGGSAADQVLAELTAVHSMVAGKATPGEAAAFGAWLVASAQAAADAAKEGGFFGIGAQQVSDREQAMIERVRAAVSG